MSARATMAWRAASLLGIFAVIAAGSYFLYAGLYLDKDELPSKLIGRPVPASVMALPAMPAKAKLHPEAPPALAAGELEGQPWLLCVWASWCPSCAKDQALLAKLKRESGITLVGLNYNDTIKKARRWLISSSSPFDHQLIDVDGHASIDLGVYGVPETYVVDAAGLVRDKVIGALDEGGKMARLRASIATVNHVQAP